MMIDDTRALDAVVELSHRPKSPLFKVTGAQNQHVLPDVDRAIGYWVEQTAKMLGWGMGLVDPDWVWSRQMWKSIGILGILATIIASSIASITLGFMYNSADCSSSLVVFLRVQGITSLVTSAAMIGWKKVVGARHPIEIGISFIYMSWIVFGAVNYYETDSSLCDSAIYDWALCCLVIHLVVYIIVFIAFIYSVIESTSLYVRIRRQSIGSTPVENFTELTL